MNITPQTTGEATYCPEDNKLRLYVGRVPTVAFLKLREEGWTCTPKQREAGGCDFVATWTPQRRDTALAYGDGVILDEDQSPAERAADRAERFAGYRDKRTIEAGGHLGRYDSQPLAHGYQDAARAERAAARHDRIADRACDAWSKAEYWTQRTAGVISHALYKSTPAVRMGRIKEIEADIRRCEKSRSEYRELLDTWRKVQAIEDPQTQTEVARKLSGYLSGYHKHQHPRPETVTSPYIQKNGASLYELLHMVEREDGTSDITGAEACALFFATHPELGEEGDWLTHYRLRLAYEEQMLEAQGGRAAHVEMEPGGFLGSYQIHKVNKSPVTGRVVSVNVWNPERTRYKLGNRVHSPGLCLLNIERLSKEVYRPPTDEERAAFEAKVKADKAERKAATPPAPQLINPTDADAQRLQDLWNERAKETHCARHLKNYGRDYAETFKPVEIIRTTQAQYSASSKGSYARVETTEICRDGYEFRHFSGCYEHEREAALKRQGPVVCKIRTASSGDFYGARRVIVITDKAQKPLPAAVWEPRAEEVVA
jgi:hypothetical protein